MMHTSHSKAVEASRERRPQLSGNAQMSVIKPTFTEEDALSFHMQERPGKMKIFSTKPLTTQRDLSLAYSPGVAWPCLRIAKDPNAAYDYTSKGNLVAAISTRPAVVALGDL